MNGRMLCLGWACLLSLGLTASGTARGEGAGEKNGGEKNAGKTVQLFDGQSLSGWLPQNGSAEGVWEAKDGMIHCLGKGTSLLSEREFPGDFELRWEWKIVENGNSGVKYRVREYSRKRQLGLEYQLLDDLRHSNAKRPETSAGALYSLYAPKTLKPLKPVGEFNESKVIARGSRVEHWLNGEKLLEVDTASDDWRERVANSKFNDADGFGQNSAGRLMLQNHGSEIWFRNLTWRPLGEAAGE